MFQVSAPGTNHQLMRMTSDILRGHNATMYICYLSRWALTGDGLTVRVQGRCSVCLSAVTLFSVFPASWCQECFTLELISEEGVEVFIYLSLLNVFKAQDFKTFDIESSLRLLVLQPQGHNCSPYSKCLLHMAKTVMLKSIMFTRETSSVLVQCSLSYCICF